MERKQLNHLKLSQTENNFSVMVPKQTIGCFLESIGCFGTLAVQPFKNSFQSFPQNTQVQTIGCFDKTISCFNLV